MWGPKRPTVMLTEDEYFNHRRLDTQEPLEGVDKDEWTPWDFAIVRAYQTIEAYTDRNGIFEWYKDDPEERIDAKKTFDPYQAGIDRITNSKQFKEHGAPPGLQFRPDIKSGREDGSMWTYAEWREAKYKEMLEKQKMVE